jgi:predicted acetyltransferase
VAAPQEVTLRNATRDDDALLRNLLELYIHDMSAIFDLAVGPDGRFGYGRLAAYWTEPATRHAFVIHCDDRLAGFALVTRGSPADDDPAVLDLAEFFVLRGQRRAGVGRRAAGALWDGLPGRWIVRVSEANEAALCFWSEVVRGYTGGAFAEGSGPELPGWRIFRFASPARPPAR